MLAVRCIRSVSHGRVPFGVDSVVHLSYVNFIINATWMLLFKKNSANQITWHLQPGLLHLRNQE